MRARCYDPQLGRFINEDSFEGQVTDPLSLNRYSYCENDPINSVDPTGNVPEWAQNLLIGTGSFFQGVGSGVMESFSYGVSSQSEEYYWKGNAIAYYSGKVVGDAASGIVGTIGTIAGGTTTGGLVLSGGGTIAAPATAAFTAASAGVAGTSLAMTGKNASNLVNSIKCKGNSSSGSKPPMNNNRVLKDTQIKGYDVSMDLERGGSGEINIHVKVNGEKYFFNSEKNMFLNSNGNRLPNSLRGNQQIKDALKKAVNLQGKGW